jgi:hypothetical protein
MNNTRRLLLLLVPLAAALGPIAASSPAGAASAGGTTIDRQDVTGSTVVCPDMVLNVTSGVLKIVTHDTLTPSGAYHLGVEANAQGVSAVAPSGAAYQAPGGFRIEANLTPGATTQTEVDVLNVVGQGSAPNFTVRGVVHLTVNANGDVTALVNHFTSTGDCTP